MEYLDAARLDALDAAAFRSQRPYPWVNPAGLLTETGYQRLLETLPDIDRLTPSFNVRRKHGQQPHDRYVLEYEAGVDVAAPWREFIGELYGPAYRRFLRRMFGRGCTRLRLHWHYAPNGASISPHCDSRVKLGSHLFYFNSAADWDPAWGGQTLILDDGGRFTSKSAPQFDDFDRAIAAETLGNYSLLFARRGQSWHGMRPIHCPPHALRKVFIVVVNDARRSVPRELIRRLTGKPRPSY